MITHGASAHDGGTQSMDRYRFMVNPDPWNPPDRLFLLTWCGYFTIKKSGSLPHPRRIPEPRAAPGLGASPDEQAP